MERTFWQQPSTDDDRDDSTKIFFVCFHHHRCGTEENWSRHDLQSHISSSIEAKKKLLTFFFSFVAFLWAMSRENLKFSFISSSFRCFSALFNVHRPFDRYRNRFWARVDPWTYNNNNHQWINEQSLASGKILHSHKVSLEFSSIFFHIPTRNLLPPQVEKKLHFSLFYLLTWIAFALHLFKLFWQCCYVFDNET